MGLFDFFKNKSKNVVWRNEKGEIYCPGALCAQEDCDETCPIWCHMMAISAKDKGDLDTAIVKFKKAVAIAPDYAIAWGNMGMVYGAQGNHIEAYKACRTAHSIDPKNSTAIFGLLLSSKNMGNFDEALKYCDEYEKVTSKDEADKLRQEIKELQAKGNVPRQRMALEMAQEIVNFARLLAIMGPNDKMPHIPELHAPCKDVCDKILEELIKDKDGRNPRIILAWGAFAGVGAVHHWNVDWDNLKKNGIAETLLAPRGVFEMDEYVVDSIGLGFKTPEGEEFCKYILGMSDWAITEFVMGNTTTKNKYFWLELMCAMYLFGMALQMERLGMK